jgi:hypothetical protein
MSMIPSAKTAARHRLVVEMGDDGFCSATCRKRANRAPNRASPAESGGDAWRVAQHSFFRVTRLPATPGKKTTKSVTLKLDPRIVLNRKWAGMYRLRRPDGTLSDMGNLDRIKDALRCLDQVATPKAA